ncbi:MAG: B12-binding domain-containing radical SAM protein [Desulfomonilaceae bacterium]
MRVLLIHPDSPRNVGGSDRSIRFVRKKAYVPPLGLITVAALLPQHWEMQLVDMTFQTMSPEMCNAADLVVISGTILQYGEIMDLIHEAKRWNKKVAVGGPGVFHFPEEALRAGADFVVKGEAETTIPRLIEAIDNDERGVFIESNEPADMTLTPIPRYDLLDMSAYVEMTMQFSRGCPFRCEFCDVTLIFGRAIRTKTPQQILNELDALYQTEWRRHVWFIDDNFIGAPAKAKALLREMIRWNDLHHTPFEFFTFASVNLAGFPDLMELMVKANFTRVYLGIETTDKESLKVARKYQNAAADIDQACQKINRAGLQIIALTMVGFDAEKPGRDIRVIEFAEKNNIPEIDATLVYAFPGTSLWQRLKKEGRLLNGDGFEVTDWKKLRMNFTPTRPASDIIREYVNIYEKLYEPTAYLRRSYLHLAQMGPPPDNVPFKIPDAFEMGVLFKTALRWGLFSKTRLQFWTLIAKLLMDFNRTRFSLFIRSCVVLERYLDMKRDLWRQLGELDLQALQPE